jgi:hypothetical protein
LPFQLSQAFRELLLLSIELDVPKRSADDLGHLPGTGEIGLGEAIGLVTDECQDTLDGVSDADRWVVGSERNSRVR